MSTLIHGWWEHETVQPLCKMVCQFLFKPNIHTYIHTYIHTHTHPKTQSFLSCVYFQQKWVSQSHMKRMSINQIYEKKLKWQSWQNGHTYNEILLSTEKEQRWAIYNHKKDSHRIMKIRKRYIRINCGVPFVSVQEQSKLICDDKV